MYFFLFHYVSSVCNLGQYCISDGVNRYCVEGYKEDDNTHDCRPIGLCDTTPLHKNCLPGGVCIPESGGKPAHCECDASQNYYGDGSTFC